jgi:two-component system sensor histidine kinase QseC
MPSNNNDLVARRVAVHRLLHDPRSLTRRLFSRATLVILIGVVLIGFAAETVVAGIINSNFDEQLELSSHLLINLMYEELQGMDHRPGAAAALQQAPLLSYEDRLAFAGYARWRTFRIWYGGRLRMASLSGPPTVLPTRAQSGHFHMIRADGEVWRIYTFAATPGDPVVEVGERVKVRSDMIRRVSLVLAAPFVLIALALLLGLWYTTRDGLAGLNAFSVMLSRQKDRPPFRQLVATDWPTELEELVEVINGLFRRIEAGIAHERKFVDMAAHQLRTPLSGLSIEAQLCARIDDPEERQLRLERLYLSTRRVSTLVDQLLNLAQIESVPSPGDEAVTVRAVLSTVIADLAPEAARRGVELAIEGEDLTLAGTELALQLMLSNIVDNAVKHSPPGEEVVVRLSEAEGWARIEVEDAGPGLDDDGKLTAFARFWQAKPGEAGGSGLGLSIAWEAAVRLGGALHMLDRPDGKRGLVVRFAAKSSGNSAG